MADCAAGFFEQFAEQGRLPAFSRFDLAAGQGPAAVSPAAGEVVGGIDEVVWRRRAWSVACRGTRRKV